MNDWSLRLIFPSAADAAIAGETLGAVLEDLGALGWTDEPPAVGEGGGLRVFFPGSVARDPAMERIREAAAALRDEGILSCVPRFALADVERADWATAYCRHFRGVRVASDLRVVPPWMAEGSGRARKFEGLTIVIEPGAAFGTGVHETTRLCLRLLKREIRGGERVADIGAGSGILAIAAVKLGARSAWAVEINSGARPNLAKNITLNRVGRKVSVYIGDAADFAAESRDKRRRFDVIVCNILAERLRPLAGSFRDLARSSRPTILIVSGHLWSERKSIARLLEEAAGARIVHHRKMGEWAGLVGRIVRARKAG